MMGLLRDTGRDRAMVEQEENLEENAVICLRLQEQRLLEPELEVFLWLKDILHFGTTI